MVAAQGHRQRTAQRVADHEGVGAQDVLAREAALARGPGRVVQDHAAHHAGHDAVLPAPGERGGDAPLKQNHDAQAPRHPRQFGARRQRSAYIPNIFLRTAIVEQAVFEEVALQRIERERFFVMAQRGGVGEPDPEPAPEENLHLVKSPIVGTFYESPSPGAPPFVKPGDQVALGQVLCIVEAMKLMNEIESDVAGELVKMLVTNNQPIEYGQPLYAIRPNA